MAKQTRREIYITCNGKSAADMLRTLTNHAAQLDAQIKKLIADGKGNTKECKEMVSVYGQLQKQLKQNISNTQMIDKVMRNLAGSTTAQLRNALQAVRREMSRTSESSGKLPQLRKQMEAIKAQIDKNTGAIHKQGGAWSTAMKNLTAYVGLFTVFNKVKSMLTGVIKENFQMSDSLADIRKVSGLLSQDIDKMAVSLAKIDTRTPVSELQKIAYAGAKLGIGNYGAEGLESFVKASNQVNVALKEDLGEEALTALSKITEVMGLIPKMGVEQSMLKTGSAIFKLASTTTATSNKIIDFSNRLLAMGKTGALSTSDILALGAAVDSMAMEPEVASTAFSKLITEMRKGTNLLEKDLGLATGSLKELLAQGKGMEALQMIFHKMHDTGNVFALDGLFKDLGSDGARLIKVMVTMAEKVDMLDKVAITSRDAFNEGIAVTQEYNIQQQTAQGILERANNMWTKAFVNPDGINSVKQMAIEWYNLSRALTQSSFAQKSALFTLEAIATSLKVLINLLPAIIGYIAGQGLVRGFMALKNIATAVWAWVTAQKALNLAMSSNVIGAVVAALSLAYTWFQKDANAAKDAADSADKFTKSLSSAKNEVGKAVAELDSYKRAIDGAKKGTKERQAVIDNFNKKFGTYLSKLLTEKSTAKDLAKAYNEVANAIERKVMAEMRGKDIKQHVEPKAGRSAQLLYNYDEKAKALGQGAYGGDWLNAFVSDNITKYGTSYTINEYIRRSGVGKNKNSQARKALFAALRNTNGTPGDAYTWQYTDKNAGGGKNASFVRTPYSDIEKLVAMGVAYIRQKAAQVMSEQEVQEKYKFYKLDDVVTEDVSGVSVSEKPDKDAIKREKQEKRDRERAWREELKQKQDQAKAIMDDVDNYYDRQINAKLAQAISLNMDEAEQKQFVLPLKQNKEIARSQVRLAVAGKENKWEDAKKMMAADMVEQADETGVNLSKDLLDGILKKNIGNLRKLMEQLGKGLGLSMNSITAQIFAKATRSEQELLKMQFKQMEERRKIAMEHDYTGIVQQNSYDNFNEMGYAAPTKEETTVTKKMVDGKEILDNSAFEKRKKVIKEMFEAARRNIAQLYAIDVTTTKGRGMLMKMLFGDDPDGMAARIKESLGESEESWKAFYQNLIQYSDNYAEAEKKKYDSAKKIVDFWWSSNKRNLAQQAKLRKMENESQMFGKRTNLLSNLGLANLTADPEIELMKARMQAAEDYYAFVERNTQNKQLIDEAEHARQEAELAYVNQVATAMKSRLSQMKELVQPIEDFGAAVGQALAEMRYDAESANDAIKSALKSMLESWAKMALNDVNTQMWKAINDAGAKRGKANAQPDIDAARANANANVIMPDFTNIGTEQNPVWVRIVDNHYENANGDRVGAPRAWRKRNGYSVEDDRDGFAQYVGQVGGEVAGVVTSGGSLSDAAANGIGAALNAPISGNGESSKDKDKQLKEEKKHQKALTKEVKKGVSDREKATDKGVKNITASTEQGDKEQSKNTEVAQQSIVNATDAALNATLTAKQKNNDEILKSDAARTEGEVTFSIAGAMAKCFEFLGPIAGPIAAAVVMSTLMGLLQWALNSALGGGKRKDSSKGPNTKVVSGMLTYDSGNVQDLRPFVGSDGSLYWATEDNKPHDGVSLLTQPTATTINGRPSLVAENGPELVIGRETTQAMMMNNPQLLKALVNYDRNYSGRRAYDTGNVAETSPTVAAGATVTDEMASYQANTNVALLQAVNTLLQRLEQPIEAKIDMYGRGKLYDSMTKANQFMKNK